MGNQTMTIESGSQNLSRIPGLYVYPKHSYGSRVEPVERLELPRGNPRPKAEDSFILYQTDGLKHSHIPRGQFIDRQV